MRIKEKREALGMTQRALAKLAGLTPAALCMIENGTRTPSLKAALRIASALGCTVEELTADTAAEQPA